MSAEQTAAQSLEAPDRLFQLRLVKAYIDKGSEEVLRTFNLSESALRDMQAQPWWTEAAREVYNGQSEALDRRFTKLIDLALNRAEERLENGDEVVDKFGDTHQVPLKGKDAAAIGALLLDKRQLLRGLPNSIMRTDIRLDAVAEKLRGIVRQDPETRVAAGPAELQATVVEIVK